MQYLISLEENKLSGTGVQDMLYGIDNFSTNTEFFYFKFKKYIFSWNCIEDEM
jgi:hypothetical protein